MQYAKVTNVWYSAYKVKKLNAEKLLRLVMLVLETNLISGDYGLVSNL